MPGHGDHWECLYENVETFAEEILPELFVNLSLTPEAPLDRPLSLEGRDFQTALAFMEDDGPVRHMVLCLRDARDQSVSVASAYPFLADGTAHRLEIRAVHEWEHGLEAQIEAATPLGSLVAFHDPLYFKNKKRYLVGQTLEFNLAGLIYRAEPGDPTPIETPEHLREQGFPAQLTLEGAAMYLPLGDEDPDDFTFHSPILNVESFVFGGRTVHRIQAKLAGDPEGDANKDLVLPLFASDLALPEGFVPQPGSDFTGILWLQGYLAEDEEF
jgi:hypothetical protein